VVVVVVEDVPVGTGDGFEPLRAMSQTARTMIRIAATAEAI
jgi:hypothetical protein